MTKSLKPKKRAKKAFLIPQDAWKNKFNPPEQISSKLFYSLDTEHNLNITLNKYSKSDKKETVSFKSEISNITSDSITFKTLSRRENAKQTYRSVSLKGRWQADRYNRIIFLIDKKDGSEDSLVFSGSWEINKNNSLTYSYAHRSLKTKKYKKETLHFKGYWELASGDRLVYILDNKIDSYFSFRCQLQTANLFPAKGKIKYKIGIGSENNNKEIKTIALFGEWKFSDNATASFIIKNSDGSLTETKFKASFKILKNNRLLCELSNTKTGELIIKTEISGKLFKKNAEFFIRGTLEKSEKRIEAGIKTRF